MSERKTVVVNGCFDLIHPGHIKLLEHAAKHGDLIVLINSDDSIEDLKGRRPYMEEKDRSEVLMAIKGVKSVMIFNSQEDLGNLYAFLTPDVMVIGDEYKDKQIVGREFAKQIVFFTKLLGYSSSSIVERIRNGKRTNV